MSHIKLLTSGTLSLENFLYVIPTS